MIKSCQALAIPIEMVKWNLVSLKICALMFDKIFLIGSEGEDSFVDLIGRNDTMFLQESGIISFESIRMYYTDAPPSDACDLETQLIASQKMAIMNFYTCKKIDDTSRYQELYCQSVSRRASMTLHGKYPDICFVPIDFGSRWGEFNDREYDEFESERYSRDTAVDPPLNTWGFYAGLFNKGSSDAYARGVSLIIEDIYVPDSTSNWGDIIDFREKFENKMMLYRLRDKLEKISGDVDLQDIAMEILSERDLFNQQIKLTKMKNTLTKARSITSFMAGIFPNILKMNWDKASDAGFTVIESNAAEIENRMNLQTDGLYYVNRIEEYFGEKAT